jgi:hypothetical protein
VGKPGASAAFVLALAAGAWLPARPVAACVRLPAEIADPRFAIDPALRASDDLPPSPITDASALVTRRTDSVCSGGQCTVNDCGSFGQLTVDYLRTPPAGEPEEVGYHVQLLSGELPPSMLELIGPIRPLSPRIVFDMAFDDAPALDAEIAIVVVDRAGNESPPSDPIRLLWSGCTLPPAGDRCIDAGSARGCSLAPIGRDAGAHAGLLLGLLVLAARRLRQSTIRLRQAEPHSSPSRRLPSSQSSPVCRMPSPQRGPSTQPASHSS